MRILAIETSCDDTAIAVIEAKGGFLKPSFKVLSSVVQSQIELHQKWQGVVPFLAKREHSKNLVPVLEEALTKAGLLKPSKLHLEIGSPSRLKKDCELEKMLEREPELFILFKKLIPTIQIPKIDLIAVTKGPGLEPALWTGINLAKALALIWKKPLVPINHMEGHIFSSLVAEKKSKKIEFPALALLISGGHTELVLAKDWMKYKIIGQTRDDAVGEAFDKVARMLGLPYLGGPEISRLADSFDKSKAIGIKFPRPMINSDDFDFSFSGLKTSVLYKIKEIGTLSDDLKKEFAYEFEEAVSDVLTSKTEKAILKLKPKTLVLGGGVSANKKIREKIEDLLIKKYPKTKLLVPEKGMSMDNALMIAISAYFRDLKKSARFNASAIKKIRAEGNMILK